MAFLGFLACVMMFVGCYGDTGNCDAPIGDIPMPVEELMVRSNILLYGEHIQHEEPVESNTTVDVAHSFMVKCIFKTDGKPIKETIYIETKQPPVGCTVMPLTGKAVVGLTRTNNGNYTFHEPSSTQSAVFQRAEMDDLFTTIKEICQLTNWTSPADSASDMCPKIVDPGFCTNYTLPSGGLRIQSCNWVLLASLFTITVAMLAGQFV